MGEVPFLDLSKWKKSGCFVLPDVREHEHEWADDDSLEDLPIAAEVGHTGHEQLTSQHHETGHHGHGEAPSWQAEFNPWQGREAKEAKKKLLAYLLWNERNM